jgi:8-oxo-dGTP pyrophosphatase MutT (NUDIX family)
VVERWRLLRSKERGSFRIFSVREDWYAHPDKEGERSFFVIETPDWVNVVAVTPDDEVVLIRQMRPGVGGVRLEIPGGVIDPGEAPADAAVRELREETGYLGAAPELLCVTEPNPATHQNRCHSYLIRDARPGADRDLDHDELIDVRTVPVAEIGALIDAEEMPHALLQLPLLRYLRRREREGAEA